MERLGRGRKAAMQRLLAVAEMSTLCQASSLKKILRYVTMMRTAGELRPILFCERMSYDETPLRLRVCSSDTVQGGVELAKVFVVETSWSMLLQDTSAEQSPFLVLQGHASPSVRSADGASAEAIAAVLKSTPHIREAELGMFEWRVRQSECDENPANPRAERMWASYSTGYTLMQLFCICHKVHTPCDKTWKLGLSVLKGATRTLLSMQSSTQMASLQRQLLVMIEEKLQVVPDALPAEAVSFRRNVLRVWLTGKLRPRHRALVLFVSGALLNGDWRSPNLQHICRGCCESRAHTMERFKLMLPKLLAGLRPRALCRGNWCEWATPLSSIGVLAGMHQLLPSLFQMAFGKEEQDFRQGKPESMRGGIQKFVARRQGFTLH